MAGQVLALAEAEDFEYVILRLAWDRQPAETGWTEKHIQSVTGMPLVDTEAIRNAGFTVAVDAVNSVGGIVIPRS